MAHKVYRWVNSDGRSTSPPPDPFDIAEQRARGDFKFGSDADEKKVLVTKILYSIVEIISFIELYMYDSEINTVGAKRKNNILYRLLLCQFNTFVLL